MIVVVIGELEIVAYTWLSVTVEVPIVHVQLTVVPIRVISCGNKIVSILF